MLTSRMVRSTDTDSIWCDLSSSSIQREKEKEDAEYHPIDLPQLDVPTFIGHLLTKKNNDGDSVKQEEGPDGKKEKEKQAFLKSYAGHRSALTFLFNKCEITPSVQFQTKMSKAMAGLKNTAAKRRGQDGGKLGEGKLPLPFDVYCAICKALAKDKDTSAVFAHCFLTMTWNLMCRSRNTVNIMMEHISFNGDSMTVQFAHTKTDMSGERAWRERAKRASASGAS
jgi:hypothetical protein